MDSSYYHTKVTSSTLICSFAGVHEAVVAADFLLMHLKSLQRYGTTKTLAIRITMTARTARKMVSHCSGHQLPKKQANVEFTEVEFPEVEFTERRQR